MSNTFRVILFAGSILGLTSESHGASLVEKVEKNDSQGGLSKDSSQQSPHSPNLAAATPRSRSLSTVTITGDVDDEEKVPGSVYVVTKEQLEKHHQTDIQRVLWEVPGVYTQGEDAYGLRPNIGMRGAGVLRSQKITVMEDGILIAPAPYAAPALHSVPIVGRMESVEVRQGSSAIEYGPFTVGGAINFRSTSIPDVPTRARADVAVGDRYSRRIHLDAGGSSDHWGWLLETYQIGEAGYRRIDNTGGSEFSAQDVVGKIRFNTSKSDPHYQELTLKVAVSTERSPESYLGLTEEDFNQDPLRLYPSAQKDHMRLGRMAVTLRHFAQLSSALDLTTQVYRQNLNRNWYKLENIKAGDTSVNIDKVLEDPVRYDREMDIIRGTTSAAEALEVKGNKRDFYSQGVDSSLGFTFGSSWSHDLRVGVRYHMDEEDRKQYLDYYQMTDGGMSLSRAGTLGVGKGNNRVSVGEAFAAYVRDRVTIGDLALSAGVRQEHISLRQSDYGASDPDRSGDPQRKQMTVSQWLPGLGASYQILPSLSTFAGMHRGFVPPTPSANQETKPETSTNIELGVRAKGTYIQGSMTGFYNQYENILGADTLASGGQGTGSLYNGGKALISGAETQLRLDPGQWLALGVNTNIFINHTYTNAQFKSTFKTDFEEWAPEVRSGDYMPLIPLNQIGFGLGVSKKNYPDLNLIGQYQGRTRVKAGSAALDSVEAIPERVVMDLSAGHDLAANQRIFFDVRNVTNRAYIAGRRPAGVRPGLPRTFLVGLKFTM